MAKRGMGIATQGGGAVSSGPRNKVESSPAAKSTGIPMMAVGGPVGLTRAAQMSGRTMPTTGNPAAMSGRAMPTTSRPAFAKGGMAKKTKKMRKGGCA